MRTGMENVEYGKCGVCGKCGVWKMWCMENEESLIFMAPRQQTMMTTKTLDRMRSLQSKRLAIATCGLLCNIVIFVLIVR